MSKPVDTAAANLGRVIHLRRVELDMKRRELAIAAGLSYPYVSEIENGQKEPSAKALRQLADALKLSSSELVNLTDRLAHDDSNSLLFDTEASRSVGADNTWRPPTLDGADHSGDAGGQGERGVGSLDGDALERRITEAIARAIHAELSYWTSNVLPRIVRAELASAIEDLERP